MPRYTFQCLKCKSIVEMSMAIDKIDKIKPLCCAEDCGGIEMELVIGPTAFTLAGDGWAKDGYSRKKD